MSPKTSKKKLERLLGIRGKLQRDLERLEEDVEKAQRELIEEANRDDRLADAAALAVGRDMGLTMEENVRMLLKKVELAIEAAEKGTYGACESCGKRIPAERLEAVPWASKCIECKRREEKR